MAQYGLPALHGLLIWWFGTGLILFIDGLPPRTFRYSMAGASVLLVGALAALRFSAADTTTGGAYLAFTAAVLVWAWLEVSFYLGYVTGPRRHACAPDCHGWRHFGHAIQASLYHEIAILVLAAAVVGLTWGKPNQFGTWTFVVLWWMHQSARLNVFLGVSNLNADFLPEHLAHLRSFFTYKPINLLFPASVTVSTLVAFVLGQNAAGAADAFGATGYVLLATMMVLAILEHWFLVLPISAARVWNGLWEWSLGARAKAPRESRPLPRQAPFGGRP